MRVRVSWNEFAVAEADLVASGLQAGRAQLLPEYHLIREQVQRASARLLECGLFAGWNTSNFNHATELYGAPVDPLQLYMRDYDGVDIDTWFVDLVESPEDNGVIVFVRFRSETGRQSAAVARRRPVIRGADQRTAFDE